MNHHIHRERVVTADPNEACECSSKCGQENVAADANVEDGLTDDVLHVDDDLVVGDLCGRTRDQPFEVLPEKNTSIIHSPILPKTHAIFATGNNAASVSISVRSSPSDPLFRLSVPQSEKRFV